MEIQVDPTGIGFDDVKLHQSYSQTIYLQNPLDAPIDFTLKPSSARYAVNPMKGRLNSRASIAITVKLYLNHMPARSNQDFIMIESSYCSPKKIPIQISLLQSQSKSRSPSPSRETGGRSTSANRSVSPDLINDLQGKIEFRDRKIQEYEELLGKLRSQHPHLEQIIHNRIEEERQSFEEKSARVIVLFESINSFSSFVDYIGVGDIAQERC